MSLRNQKTLKLHKKRQKSGEKPYLCRRLVACHQLAGQKHPLSMLAGAFFVHVPKIGTSSILVRTDHKIARATVAEQLPAHAVVHIADSADANGDEVMNHHAAALL